MLTSQSSPVATAQISPRFHPYHYGQSQPPQHRTTNLSSARRRSTNLEPSPSPKLVTRRAAVHYVDRGTQWSPIVNPKMENPVAVSPLAQPEKSPLISLQQRPSIIPSPRVSSAIPPTTLPEPPAEPPAEPVIQPESPSTKRREPPLSEEDASGSDDGRTQDLPARNVRSRPTPAPIKVLPTLYEFCAVDDMVILIATMIQELMDTNDRLPPREGVGLTRFHSRTPPGISVLDYLRRLAKHATLTPPLLLAMVYYIDRLCTAYSAFTMTTLTVHRFLITAATVAAKGLSDSFWNNSTYARVGGIKIAELGLLELDFLYRVDWRIVPQPEVLVEYYKGLVSRTAGYELQEPSSEASSDADDEDDELGDSDEKESVESPESKAEATEGKWQEWMDDRKKEGDETTKEGRDDVIMSKEESIGTGAAEGTR